VRQAVVTRAACCSDSDGWFGVQRRQGRNPAPSAAAALVWNATFSGRAARAVQDGRQYTPVVRTE
jgi:hypothetical protein